MKKRNYNFEKIMARNFFLLFLFFIIVGGLSIWGYFVWNETQYDNPPIEKFSSKNTEYLSKKQSYSLISPGKLQNVMQKAIENIDNKKLKKAIVLKPNLHKYNVSETGFQKSHFWINPQIFQSLFLKLIASQLNFLNLKLEFHYYKNYQKVKVKISNSYNPNNKVFKNFQINILKTLKTNE